MIIGEITMTQHLEGFETAVHRSLIEPILLAGLPRNVALVLWTMTGALVMGMRQLWVLPVALAIHLPLMLITRREPFFFDFFFRALRAPKRLDV
jgi:type IV secretion system protein VirB3